jgi:hypothetical protein
MVTYLFIFRNADTGEVRSGRGHALNAAARSIGLRAAPLEHPWTPWECWEAGECIWHYTLEGERRSGPREG